MTRALLPLALPMNATASGAILSEDGAYRYRLWRRWPSLEPSVVFVMLNPSTADADQDDPTIRRCIGFARRWGFGGIEVVNLFALRTSDPLVLLSHPDPVGPENAEHIRQAVSLGAAKPIIVAWGEASRFRARADLVAALIRARRVVRALGVTKSGDPRHPLFMRRDVCPVPWPQDPARETEPFPHEPTPGAHYWISYPQMRARWPSLAGAEPAKYCSSCLWCGSMRGARAELTPCKGIVRIELRGGAQ